MTNETHTAITRSRRIMAMVGMSAASMCFATAGQAECPSDWSYATGHPGFNDVVYVQTTYNGDLIAGGRFTAAGGQTVNGIARWDGDAWHPLGSGIAGGQAQIHALTVYDNDLIVGGSFVTAGGQTVNNIARWDGSQWHAMSGNCPDTWQSGCGTSNIVRALTTYDGNLIAAGNYSSIGGIQVTGIARWDGSEWHPLENANINGDRYVLAEYNGDLIVGGSFTFVQGTDATKIVRWDGTNWHAMNATCEAGEDCGPNGTVRALVEHNGDLIVGGSFNSDTNWKELNNITRWDGSSWHPFVVGDEVGVSSAVRTLAVFDEIGGSTLYVGGGFSQVGGEQSRAFARWTGSYWQTFAGIFEPSHSASVWAMSVFDDGNGPRLYASGSFATVSDVDVNNSVVWHGCPDAGPTTPGDLNGDGVVDVSDLLILLSQWAPCADPGDCPADLNGDGVVDVSDLLILLGNWG